MYQLASRLLCVALYAVISCSAAAATDTQRPNFLFILTDDQAADSLGAYGGRVCQTPTLDRLAAQGMTFDAAHHMGSWSGAVCTASRRMIMTGRSVWRIPGTPATDQLVPADLANHSLPAIFNRAGYDTFRTCKVENSYEEANTRFAIRHDATMRENTPEMGSAWHAERVLDYLDKRHAAGDQDPFLIYFGFSHPHDPRRGRPELLAKYGAVDPGPPASPNPKSPPLPVSYLPAHPFHHGHPDLRDEVAVEGVDERRDEATVRNELGKQYACIEDIDTQIERVLDKLDKLGLRENTYVFFSSDHGIAVGSHGLMGKQNLYEHSWRVPLLVRGPGIAPGSRTDAMVYLHDLLPTLCTLADIDTPTTVDAESYAAVLRGEASSARDVLYGVYAGGTHPGIRAVKTGRWKLVEHDVLDGSVRRTQLFDLDANPQELIEEHHSPGASQTNLADRAEHAAELARLRAVLRSESERYGDPFPIE